MALWGADVQAVQTLGNQLGNQARTIESILGQLTGLLNNTPWVGPDADQFRNDWQSVHTPSLRKVVDALNTASTAAIRNAQAQQDASTQM